MINIFLRDMHRTMKDKIIIQFKLSSCEPANYHHHYGHGRLLVFSSHILRSSAYKLLTKRSSYFNSDIITYSFLCHILHKLLKINKVFFKFYPSSPILLQFAGNVYEKAIVRHVASSSIF